MSVRPGLSGVGSIVFRDEERMLSHSRNPLEFYRTVIAPYKEELEIWFVDNKSIKVYLTLILVTVWVVVFSDSRLLWQLFPSLPEEPENLKV